MIRPSRFPRLFAPAQAISLVLLLATIAFWPQAAQAQVNRCTTNSGTVVFTDRPCSAIGASERLPRGASAPGVGARRAGCARNLQDLMYEITAAIDQRDVNRLGAVYHWVGMSPESGYRVLDRLQVIVDRPLVDIVAIRGGGAPRPAPNPDSNPNQNPDATSSAIPSLGDVDAPNATSETENALPAPPRPRRGGPIGLRLEQTLRNSATPSRMVFGLRRHLDCWWVVLANP